MELSQKDIDRFWSKVDKNGRKTKYVDTCCWEWTGGLSSGYGQFHHDKYSRAHRFSYAKAFGSFDKSLLVLHKCHNPPCVRPNHLYLGTTQDNIDDKMLNNRQVIVKGSDVGTSKLTEKEVLKIREMAKETDGIFKTFTLKEIAKIFDVSHKHIEAIIRRVHWKHI